MDSVVTVKLKGQNRKSKGRKMADADSREGRRRRRILQQGTDRLAFIKGQIQSLPTPSDHPDTALPNPDLPHGEAEEESISVLQNRDASKSSITQIPPLNNNRQDIETHIHPISEIEPEYVQVRQQPEPEPEPEPEPVTLNSSHRIFQQQETTTDCFINPSDLSSAINASRVTRLCCSITVALLVIASYLGFSLFGTEFMKTLIGFRPLYLVLFTNATLVIARLVSGKKIGFGMLMSRRRSNNSSGSSDWDAQLARTLEIGLVLKTVADAVFMDCAVYAIVLICGLSLVHP